MTEVEFYYKGQNIKIQCNQYEKMNEIFKKFSSKAGTNKDSFVFIYNGNIITNEELTFDELSNKEDKKRKKMNILVSKSIDSNFSQFVYEKCIIEDESMKDFAEMTILLALQKYPDDDVEKCLLIKEKFEEKYGGRWGASFIKNGDSVCHYYGAFIKVKYAGYMIKILKTRDDQ